MIGPWKLGAQLSTSHSSPAALDPRRNAGDRASRAGGDRPRSSDCRLSRGAGNLPRVLRSRAGRSTRRSLWYGALSDIEGMDGVGPRRELARRTQPRLGRLGRKGARGGGDVPLRLPEQSGRAPEDDRGGLRELLARYDFAGVFLDKIRFPSPANGVGRNAVLLLRPLPATRPRRVDLDLDAVVEILADRAIDPWRSPPRQRATGSPWLDALLAGNPLLSRFLRFRADSVAASRRRACRRGAAHGPEGVARPVLALPCAAWSARTIGASSDTATGRSR